MANNNKHSKQYYWHKNDEYLLSSTDEIVLEKNNLSEHLINFFNLEKQEKSNTFIVEDKKVYFRNIGPHRKDKIHYEKSYQEKRKNSLRVMKKDIKDMDIDYFIGMYFIDDIKEKKAAFLIIDSKYFYEDNRREILFQFHLDEIKKTLKKDNYHMGKNLDSRNKKVDLFFINNKVFLEKLNENKLIEFFSQKFKHDSSNVKENKEILINQSEVISDSINFSKNETKISEEMKRYVVSNYLVRDSYEQKKFKDNLINEVMSVQKNNDLKYQDMLDILKIENREINHKLLIASHIKDFQYSDYEESFDINNGLLLPVFIDPFFDKKLISFNPDDGTVILSNYISQSQVISAEIIDLLKSLRLNINYLNDDRKRNLKWHNDKIIIKSKFDI